MSLEAITGWTFRRPALLTQALSHAGAPKKNAQHTYERLEFLGDRVLGVLIAEILLSTFPQEAEGQIARRYAALVRKETLVDIALSINLVRYIHLPADIKQDDVPDNILADVIEALLGALYLDGGLHVALSFVRQYWTPFIQETAHAPVDAKSALQEWAQQRGLGLPQYTVLKTSGAQHNPTFYIEVSIQTVGTGTGEGLSRKKAEQAAALALLEKVS
jgi:ribonuclease III